MRREVNAFVHRQRIAARLSRAPEDVARVDQVAASVTSRVRLAQAAPFRIGALEAVPALRELRRGGAVETLEPRVMQVLVALHEAAGGTVGRDALIERCWDGTVVGDNAINRVISRLRRAADGIAAGCFRVETVTKVGYRLVPLSPAVPVAAREPPVVAEPPAVTRRTMLTGAAAVLAAGAVAGAALWRRRTGSDRTSAAAQNFYDRGQEAQRLGTRDGTLQAIAYFEEAVRRDARFAAAWGALALGYRHLLDMSPDDAQVAIAARSRAAARRALALEPGQFDARMALALLPPPFRHWSGVQAACERLLRERDHWLLRGTIGRVLCETGRCREAAAMFAALIDRDAFLPISRINYTLALWGSGRVEESERAIGAALRVWPGHPGLWSMRLTLLTLGGRPDAALRMIAQADARPPMRPEIPDAVATAAARALDAGAAAGIARAGDAVLASWEARGIYSPIAAQYLATLGRPDDALRAARRYLLPADPEPGPLRRTTSFLFMPSTARMRRLPGFAALLGEVGLDAYWRTTGSMPDFRRARA